MDRHNLEGALRPIVGGVVLLLTLLLILGSAIRDPRPHDVPIGLHAPPPVAEQLAQAFGAAAPGAFTITTYGSEAEALAAIDRREVVGALIVAEAGPRLAVPAAPGRSWAEQAIVVAVYAVSAGILGVTAAAWLTNGLGDGVWLAMGI